MKKVFTILLILTYSSLALGSGTYTPYVPPPKTDKAKKKEEEQKKKIDCSLEENKDHKDCNKEEEAEE